MIRVCILLIFARIGGSADRTGGGVLEGAGGRQTDGVFVCGGGGRRYEVGAVSWVFFSSANGGDKAQGPPVVADAFGLVDDEVPGRGGGRLAGRVKDPDGGGVGDGWTAAAVGARERGEGVRGAGSKRGEGYARNRSLSPPSFAAAAAVANPYGSVCKRSSCV